MNAKKYLLIIILCLGGFVHAQNKNSIVSGPMLGQVEYRNAVIWLEVSPAVKKVELRYNSPGGTVKTVVYKAELGKDFNPIKFELNGLEFNTTYSYSIYVDGKAAAMPFKTQFTTKDLWEYRKPVPDFSFLTGSCAYFNEPIYDRPGKPYGGDSSIFETMGNTPAAFHVWLGDNWYTREVDYNTAWGLNYRASRDRSWPVLGKLLASMPQYAIWDDHDYGPNDEGKAYILKDDSRRVFMNYWPNPSYGEDGKGIYTKVSYADADIFLTDDRFFRSEDETPDSVYGKPNPDKHFFGPAQMEWLKNALSYSKATFKFIVVGSQVLNTYNDFECMVHYSSEYYELQNFLATQKISGVVFITGDRHHSEVVKKERPGLYPLYDITVSPYTSGVAKVRGAELKNPVRINGTLVEEQNFGKLSISGKKGERVLKVEFIGIRGAKLAEWSVSEKELIPTNGVDR